MFVSDPQKVELHNGTELDVQYLGASGDDTTEFEVELADNDGRRRWLL